MGKCIFRHGLQEIERHDGLLQFRIHGYFIRKSHRIPQFLQLQISFQIIKLHRQRNLPTTDPHRIAKHLRQVNDRLIERFHAPFQCLGRHTVQRIEQKMVIDLQIRHLKLGIFQMHLQILLNIQRAAQILFCLKQFPPVLVKFAEITYGLRHLPKQLQNTKTTALRHIIHIHFF